MVPSLRDTTFGPGEREALESSLRGSSAPTATSLATASLATASLASASLPAQTGTRRIIKQHTCPVTYPDGSDGFCSYERKAPALHRFRFMGADGKTLASLWHSQTVPSGTTGIEGKATELTATAFADAVERERKDYFARASEGSGRVKCPERFQMSAERAKEIGGRYALCVSVGDTGTRLLPLTATYDTLEAVNAAWRKHGDTRLVVACGNRLDRCWERPRLSPLYKEFPAMAPRVEALPGR